MIHHKKIIEFKRISLNALCEFVLGRRWVCFVCGGLFVPGDTKECDECHWLKCPYCDGCLCNLGVKERIVALSVYLSHARSLRGMDRLQILMKILSLMGDHEPE